MQVSREIDYGIRAMVILAMQEDAVLSKRHIATEFCIPVNFLALILPKLVRAGLVESLPGPRGGYRLAKPSEKISMHDVVCAIGGQIVLNRCLGDAHGCELMSRCPATKFWRELQGLTVDYLKGVTFDRIAARR
jgi:Rrf2 family protein